MFHTSHIKIMSLLLSAGVSNYNVRIFCMQTIPKIITDACLMLPYVCYLDLEMHKQGRLLLSGVSFAGKSVKQSNVGTEFRRYLWNTI